MTPTEQTTTAYHAEQYANNHPPGIERLYWHRARNRILLRKLLPYVSSQDFFFDLGCGPGVVVEFLRGRGLEGEGGDLGTPPFVVPGVEHHLHLGTDAFTLPAALRERVTILLLMDVLEHLPAPERFLSECSAAFPNVACIYITLPARMEIWSNYDEYYGHFCRYTLETIRGIRLPTDFQLTESGYFFHSLYWAARAARPFSRDRKVRVSAPRLPVLHDAIGSLFALEERIFPATHPGSSMYAIARRS